MTIKSRLLIAFSILVAIVILLSMVPIVSELHENRITNERFENYKQLFLWRELNNVVDMQWRSLNYYVILNDQSEKEKFKDQIALISQKVKSVQPQTDEVKEWFAKYNRFNTSVSKSFEEQSRDKLFDLFSTELHEQNRHLGKFIDERINGYAKNIDYLEHKSRRLNRLNFIYSVALGFLSVISGAVLSILIFRSITWPLSELQKGTKIIGDGNLDFKIEISSKDEFGQLADSFNLMVKNLHDMQLQVIQMDRMSSIGQLAGGVAHEINNPLTGVLGQTQLLLEKTPEDHPYRKNLERIEMAAQRCRRIVRALLDFARDKTYNFHHVDIVKLIDEALSFTKSDMEARSIDIEKLFPPDLPKVKVSPGHIQQVFLNIIANAIQATPDGGKLTITALVCNSIMEIRFTDSGMGISKENLSHVFDPFFTTKEVGKGTGLGLTISYGIVQRHKGEIVAVSEGQGKGATFIVKLPVSV